MKKGCLKLVMATMAMSVLVGGVTPVGNDFYRSAAIEQMVKAAIANEFDAETKKLTLHGKVVKDDVAAYKTMAKEVVVAEDAVLPASSSYLFSGFTVLERATIKGDLSKVTNMYAFFNGCSKLNYVSFGKVDTSKVTSMGQMFSGCTSLKSLNLDMLNTDSLTSTFGMFMSSTQLKSLVLGKLNMTNVTNASQMFSGCTALETIYVGSNWNLDNVTDSSSMFYNCTSLKGGRGYAFNSQYTDKTYARVDGRRLRGYLTAIPTFTQQPTEGFADPGKTFTTSWDSDFEPTCAQVVFPTHIVQLETGTQKTYELPAGGPYKVRLFFGSTPLTEYIDSDEFYVSESTPISTYTFTISDFEKLDQVTADSPLSGAEVLSWGVYSPFRSGYSPEYIKWYLFEDDGYRALKESDVIGPGAKIRVNVAIKIGNGHYIPEEYGGTINGMQAKATAQLSGTISNLKIHRTLSLEYDVPNASVTSETQDMLRLYNPNSGEHFYTASVEERDNLVSLGWQYEGIAWKAPVISEIPVYRLFNPNDPDHHYTMDEAERDMLVNAGWILEGIGWYSDVKKGVPLYRVYNPNATSGCHHYTSSPEERDNLIALGWRDEGIAWYGVWEGAFHATPF